MKPTEQQLKVLQNYLRKTLTYRETYEEIYDHILSAVEHQPNQVSFEDAINNVIRNDFGSPDNLLKIEKANKDALVKETINMYMKYLGYYCKLPGLLYTLGAASLSYYFFSQMKFGPAAIVGIFALVVLYPALIWGLRLYYTGYNLGSTQKSAKDKLFENLAGLPTRICLVLLMVVNLSDYKLWDSNNYYLITLFFVVGIFYNVALYQLYRTEFKNIALGK
jgi:hypothetical protein